MSAMQDIDTESDDEDAQLFGVSCNDGTSISEIMHKNKDDFRIRLFWSIVFIIGIPVASCVLHFTFGMDGTEIVAIILIFCHFGYFGQQIFFVIGAKSLHRAKPHYKVLNGWVKVPVLGRLEEIPQISIRSISEFSSIRGTFMHTALMHIGTLTFTSYLTIFLMNCDEWSESKQQTLAACFSLGAGSGLLWLSWWDLDYNDPCHVVMHYIGCIMCLGANVGLGFEVNWGWIFWVISIPSVLGFIAWVYFDLTAKQPSNDAKYVNRIAVICLFSEGMVLLSGTVALDVYIFITTLVSNHNFN